MGQYKTVGIRKACVGRNVTAAFDGGKQWAVFRYKLHRGHWYFLDRELHETRQEAEQNMERWLNESEPSMGG